MLWTVEHGDVEARIKLTKVDFGDVEKVGYWTVGMSSRQSEILERLQRMKEELAKKERRLRKLKRLSSSSPHGSTSSPCRMADPPRRDEPDGVPGGRDSPRRSARSCVQMLLSQSSSDEACAIRPPHEGEAIPDHRTFESIDRLLFGDSPTDGPDERSRRTIVDGGCESRGSVVTGDAASVKRALDRLVEDARTLLPGPFDPCLGFHARLPQRSRKVRAPRRKARRARAASSLVPSPKPVPQTLRTKDSDLLGCNSVSELPRDGPPSPVAGPRRGKRESKLQLEHDISPEEPQTSVADVVCGPRRNIPGDAEGSAEPTYKWSSPCIARGGDNFLPPEEPRTEEGCATPDVAQEHLEQFGTERPSWSLYRALQCSSCGAVEAVDVVEGTPPCVVAVQNGAISFWNLDNAHRGIHHASRRRPQRHCVLRGGPNFVHVVYVASGELSCLRYDVCNRSVVETCPGRPRGEGEGSGTHLLATVRESSFAAATAAPRGGTRVRLYEVLRDATWRIRTVGRASGPLGSLLRIDGLPGALLGGSGDVAYLWNCDECVLVRKVVLEASPNPQCIPWAGAESGLLFYVAGSANGCHLVALNPFGGSTDIVTDYAQPYDDSFEDGKWAAEACVGDGSVVAVRRPWGVCVWNLADGTIAARMHYADASSLALGRADGRRAMAVGSVTGNVLVFVR